MNDDLISRQAAIDALKEHRALFCDNTPDTFSKLSYAEKSRVVELDMAIATLVNLPSAQPERTDCTECEEYDSETKSCPKYCDVIRQTLAEAQPECTGRWIEYVEDGYVECPFCHSATNCDGNISELHFCFSCGARMEEPEDIPMEYFENGGR